VETNKQKRTKVTKPENSLGVKRLGRETDRLPPSSAVPLLSMYINVAHRNFFTLFYINEA
jgi:hypothetical protein